MKQLTRRSFLASSVKAALFSSLAAGSSAFAQRSTPWTNWSGGQTCSPTGRIDVGSEGELARILSSTSGPIRPVGSGHSFSPLVPTDGQMIVIDRLNGVIDHDNELLQATFGAGARLGDLGSPLEALGQAMLNLPDIDRQTVAGAIATGTHGTGVNLKNLSGYITSMRLVTPNGQVLEIDASDGDLFNAARVNLGSLGVVTQITMQNRKTYRLIKKEWAAPTEDILQNFDELAATHRHFEIFPLVYSDFSLVLSIDETTEDIRQVLASPEEEASLGSVMGLAANATPAERREMFNSVAATIQPTESVDTSHKILSNVRNGRFNEMEYSVPAEAGAECLREILQTIYDEAIEVVFPLEYRYVSGDDIWMSMSYGQEPHATISIHRDASQDYSPYFDRIEPIFWKYEGRPHWGKLHSLGYNELRNLYPRFNDFLEIRNSLDPSGRMLNEHLRALFNA